LRSPASCETRANKTNINEPFCRLAAVYAKLGRRSDADPSLPIQGSGGDAAAYRTLRYAQWGDTRSAHWLETAKRLQDAGVGQLRPTHYSNTLRKEPRSRRSSGIEVSGVEWGGLFQWVRLAEVLVSRKFGERAWAGCGRTRPVE